jgi:hypothetical protein
MCTDKRFFGFRVVSRDELTYDITETFKLVFIDVYDLENLSEEEILDLAKEGDELASADIMVGGSLNDPRDIQQLIDWVNITNYTPSLEDEQTIKDALNMASVDEGLISTAIDNDCALEAFSATEGPLDNLKALIKDKVQRAVTRATMTRENKLGTQLEPIYDNNEKKISQELIAGGEAKPTTMTEAQIASYYIERMTTEKPIPEQLYPLFMLTQEQSSLNSLRKAITLIEAGGGDMSSAWAKIKVALGAKTLTEEQEKEFNSAVLALQQKILFGIKAAKEKKWTIAGYTMNEELAEKWGNSTSAQNVLDEVVEINEKANRNVFRKLIKYWPSMDDSTKAKFLDKLLPKSITSGRSALMAYLLKLNSPLTNWLFALCLEQGKAGQSIKREAIDLLTDTRYTDDFRNLFETYGTAGLKLGEGEYTSAAMASGKGAAQLLILREAMKIPSYEMKNLMTESGAWKSVAGMNAEWAKNLAKQVSSRALDDKNKAARITKAAASVRRRLEAITTGPLSSPELKKTYRGMSDTAILDFWEASKKSGTIPPELL